MTRNVRYFCTLFTALLLFYPEMLLSETLKSQRRIRAIGRKSVTVTTREIHFGDIAKVSSPSLSDDEIVIGLKKIFIEQSPSPGERKTISASRVLERLNEEGVDSHQIGYALPRIITVTRASRLVRADEVREAITKALKDMGREATVENIDYHNNVHVVPGEVMLQARQLDSFRPGFMDFQLQAVVEGEQPILFPVTTTVNEWLQVPVAKHPIPRGSLVTAGDVVMARLNVAAIPMDTEHKLTSIVGLRTSRNIGYGEVFRKNKLSIPPVVEQGSKVTMVYKTKYLEATATGIALEAGAEGDEVRVRNEASRKIVSGQVLGPGLVGVTQ